MAISYTKFHGKRVSKKWHVVLRHAERAGVNFQLNSGRRTITEQTKLFNQNMMRSGVRWIRRPGRPLTAWPSPTAPHIRVGRANHALDVDQFVGNGVSGLARHLRHHGAKTTFPVSGEPWHLEISNSDLTKLWRALR